MKNRAAIALLAFTAAWAWVPQAHGAPKGKKKSKGAGIVKITSMPIGAAVEVDGDYHCHTPCTTEIPAGSHSFKVSMKGYVDAYRTIEVRPDIVEKMKFNLAKSGKGKIKSLPTMSFQTVAEKGFLTVKSNPSGLQVRINGSPVDDETPLTVEIEQGKYYVTVQYGDAVMEKVVDVPPDETTLVIFDTKNAYGETPGATGKSEKIMEGKKSVLDEMMSTGFSRLIIGSEEEGPFSVLVEEEPTGVGPDPTGKYQLVLPAGQTVLLSFAKADHVGQKTSLLLTRDHEYRLHVDFMPDYESQLQALMARRPDIEAEPQEPEYEPETYTKKKNTSRCLAGGILLSIGLTSWAVAPIMIVGGVRLGEKGLAVGGGVFMPLGLAFNIWGIYNLVTGCKKETITDEDAVQENDAKKQAYEEDLADWEEARQIDEQIEKLKDMDEKEQDSGSVDVTDMGQSGSSILSPEAEELSKEIYGTGWQ